MSSGRAKSLIWPRKKAVKRDPGFGDCADLALLLCTKDCLQKVRGCCNLRAVELPGSLSIVLKTL